MFGAARGLRDYRQVRARGMLPLWKKLLGQQIEGFDVQFFMNASTVELSTVHANAFHSSLEKDEGLDSAAQSTDDTEGS